MRLRSHTKKWTAAKRDGMRLLGHTKRIAANYRHRMRLRWHTKKRTPGAHQYVPRRMKISPLVSE
jgi:hypothetical protein